MSNCIEYATLNGVDGVEGSLEPNVPGTAPAREGDSTEATMQALSNTPSGHKITY